MPLLCGDKLYKDFSFTIIVLCINIMIEKCYLPVTFYFTWVPEKIPDTNDMDSA